MKIAINATILGDKPSGLGVYTMNIIRGLARVVNKRDEVLVFTPYPEMFDGAGVATARVSKYLEPKYGKLAGMLRIFWMMFVYPERARREGCDVIFSTTHNVAPFSRLPQVVVVHDLLPLIYPQYYKLRHLYFRFVLGGLLKKCRAIVAVSENTKRDLIKYYGIADDRIGVVPNGYDSNTFTPAREPSCVARPYILSVGAAYPHKNLERAIEAYTMLDEAERPDYRIVGGRKPYLDSLRQMVERRRIKGITITDYVSTAELVRLYSQAKFLLFPSLYEGFGLPALEAMACGCPVIASKTSSIPEICGEACEYVDPNNSRDLYKKMSLLLKDEFHRQNLAKMGQERAKVFDWSKSALYTFNMLKNA